MSFDLQTVLEGKRKLRIHLAARPLVEKLRLLDALRKRELAIRASAVPSDSTSGILRENPVPDRTKPR